MSIKTIFLATLFTLTSMFAHADVLISQESNWNYYDLGDISPADWTNPTYDDGTWVNGPGGFGYNETDEIGTTLASTDAQSNKIHTVYFRTSFAVSNAGEIISASIDLRRDDGAIIYLNGTEILRDGMNAGTVTFNTFSTQVIADPNEDAYFNFDITSFKHLFNEGVNAFAVEIHQCNATSSDLIFDLQLNLVIPNPDAPSFLNDPILLANTPATHLFSGTLADQANDPNGDPLTFAKLTGPGWLIVATNGALSGTPLEADVGNNIFTVSVDDQMSGSDTAELRMLVTYPDGSLPATASETARYRLTWSDDPMTVASIGWEQLAGNNAVVLYGTEDHGRNGTAYSSTQTVTRVGLYSHVGDITTCFAKLTNLQPDTPYYFVLQDEFGISPRFWFRTAPDTPKPFTFIAGGDSRNNRDPRRDNNRLVAKLRPLFVAFTGDMIDTGAAIEWTHWLDDWQETISEDGRIYPLIPHIGNHEERSNEHIDQLFDVPAELYYAVNLGGDLMRYYTLHTEMFDADYQVQTTWLTSDLQLHSNATHRAAGYHKPMRPHSIWKVNNELAYTYWAQLFFDYGMDLVFEADTHLAKRTWPIRPDVDGDDGFTRDDIAGTVYVGEGCWGAPLKNADTNRSWTAASASFYGLQWIHVYPDYMELYTVKAEGAAATTALEEGDVFSIPAGLVLWEPASGTRVLINHGATQKTSYAEWQINQWGLPAPPTSRMTEDPDGDGLSNLSEFSFGLNPMLKDAPDGSQGIVLPIVETKTGLHIKYRRTLDTSLTYRYQTSSDLMNWRDLIQTTDYTETRSDDGLNEQVDIEFSGSFFNTNNSAFIRINYRIQHP